MFSTIDFDENIEQIVQEIKKEDDDAKPINTYIGDSYFICDTCDVKMSKCDCTLVCYHCGYTKKWEGDMELYSKMIGGAYNVSPDSYNNKYKFYGKDSAAFKNESSDLTGREMKIKEKLTIDYPDDIVKTTIDLYNIARKYASDYHITGKQGVFAPCLYFACSFHGEYFSDNDIIKYMETDKRNFNRGKMMMQRIRDPEVEKIISCFNELQNRLNIYFRKLDIPITYKDFVIHIIDRANKKLVNIKTEYKIQTKCVAVISLLCERVPSLRYIDDATVEKMCETSRCTFKKYKTLLIENHEFIEKSFRKFGIPMPRTWRK